MWGTHLIPSFSPRNLSQGATFNRNYLYHTRRNSEKKSDRLYPPLPPLTNVSSVWWNQVEQKWLKEENKNEIKRRPHRKDTLDVKTRNRFNDDKIVTRFSIAFPYFSFAVDMCVVMDFFIRVFSGLLWGIKVEKYCGRIKKKKQQRGNKWIIIVTTI